MQRRNLLIGMGSIAAGGAATIGTGAFTSVDASRTVNVNVAGDASAYLRIIPEDTPNGKTYVDDTAGDTVKIDLDGTDNSSGGGSELGSGINANAETKFANLLRIENQGTQEILVGVDDDAGFINNVDGGVFAEGPDSNPGTNSNPNFPDPDGDGDQDDGSGFAMPDDPVILGVGDAVENIGLDINNPSTIPSDGTLNLKIQAFTPAAFGTEFPSFTAPTDGDGSPSGDTL